MLNKSEVSSPYVHFVSFGRLYCICIYNISDRNTDKIVMSSTRFVLLLVVTVPQLISSQSYPGNSVQHFTLKIE